MQIVLSFGRIGQISLLYCLHTYVPFVSLLGASSRHSHTNVHQVYLHVLRERVLGCRVFFN